MIRVCGLASALVVAILLLTSGPQTPAAGHGATVIGLDMIPDDDGDTVPDNTGTSLGTIDPCLEVANTQGITFDIDLFVDAIPADQDLSAFDTILYWPQSVVDLTGKSWDGAVLPAATHESDFGDAPPDHDSPTGSSIVDFFSPTGEPAPAGTQGFMMRFTFTVGTDTDGDTSVDTTGPNGLYLFTINPTVGLLTMISSSNENWAEDLDTDGDGNVDADFLHDGNHSPAFGVLALGVPCQEVIPTPTPGVGETPSLGETPSAGETPAAAETPAAEETPGLTPSAPGPQPTVTPPPETPPPLGTPGALEAGEEAPADEGEGFPWLPVIIGIAVGVAVVAGIGTLAWYRLRGR